MVITTEHGYKRAVEELFSTPLVVFIALNNIKYFLKNIP